MLAEENHWYLWNVSRAALIEHLTVWIWFSMSDNISTIIHLQNFQKKIPFRCGGLETQSAPSFLLQQKKDPNFDHSFLGNLSGLKHRIIKGVADHEY